MTSSKPGMSHRTRAGSNAGTDPRGLLKAGRADADTSGVVAPTAGRTTAGIADKEGP